MVPTLNYAIFVINWKSQLQVWCLIISVKKIYTENLLKYSIIYDLNIILVITIILHH